MGNSQTKESRGHSGNQSHYASGTGSPSNLQDANDIPEPPTRPSAHARRSSRSELTSFLGIGGSAEQDTMSLEARRELKVEREARKAEKEKQLRLKERERSMREEHVDGGYLVTQGVYVGPEDYNKTVVRQLMVERRLAPFWRGLNEYSQSWAEHQLMAAARGLPIPPPDHVPPELEYTLTRNRPSDAKVKGMTIPINSRTQSFQSDMSQNLTVPNSSLPSLQAAGSATSPSGLLARPRAKTLASLTSSRHNGSADATPREFQLPPDPFVNGQPIEVYLYKDADECPVCFLSYPPYLNTTRCCEQSICSECFVQIKRPDPHPPEHEQPDPNAPPMSEEDKQAQAEGLLVSEVAQCPYCRVPEFGITYTPPPFRRGLTYGAGPYSHQVMSPMSSQTSLSSGQASPNPNRRRGTSLSANAPEVITTDKIRPDWFSKLQTARAHAARRSAAATALHTAAYLMGPPDRSGFGGFGRRGMRRSTLDGEPTNEAQRHAMAFLAERHHQMHDPNLILPPPRGSSSRRTRIDDIEDLMMIEAIRMSLASEEERRRKEEKEAKKKAKKDEKESRRAEKANRKNSFMSNLPSPTGQQSNPLERSISNISSLSADDSVTKGKEVQRNDGSEDTGSEQDRPTPLLSVTGTAQDGASGSVPIPLGAEPFRRSHLRQMSNASSASSSFADPGLNHSASGTPTGSVPTEPMFNFRSLTAMISEDEKMENATYVEHREHHTGRRPSLENLEEDPMPGSSSLQAALEATRNGYDHHSKTPDIYVDSIEKQANGHPH